MRNAFLFKLGRIIARGCYEGPVSSTHSQINLVGLVAAVGHLLLIPQGGSGGGGGIVKWLTAGLEPLFHDLTSIGDLLTHQHPLPLTVLDCCTGTGGTTAVLGLEPTDPPAPPPPHSAGYTY
jgi:hypothetical protein